MSLSPPQWDWMQAEALVDGKTVAANTPTWYLKENDLYHYYFLREATDPYMHYYRPSTTSTEHPALGVAKYYDLVVDGKELKDAAWYYPNAPEQFERIRNRITFRVSFRGDTGGGILPLHPTGIVDGVTIDESWFA
ncbi:MAG: hypothetical protein M1820_007032, partial [Bogoriella megaspora]